MRLHALALATAVAQLTTASLFADSPEDVRVVNFPEVQPVRGSVEIGEPAPTSRLASFSEVAVSPVSPDTTENLVLAGTLEADGFRTVVLSVAGDIKSNNPTQGAVGALLVPDAPFIREAFKENGEPLLSVRIDAPVVEGRSLFAATRPRIDLGFPSYRVYFFNTTEQPSSVVLYALLAN